jgi:hypothetical protein
VLVVYATTSLFTAWRVLCFHVSKGLIGAHSGTDLQVLSSTSAKDTISSAERIFSKYIFFCNGELQVVSVSEAQKCTKGCNIATKRQTCF